MPVELGSVIVRSAVGSATVSVVSKASSVLPSNTNVPALPISSSPVTVPPALTIRSATTSVDGIVQLSDSTGTTSSVLAATPTAVKSAYDLAALALPAAGGTVTGELLIGGAGTLVFEGSTSDGNETTLAVADPTADRTITLPNVTGTVVTTGDSGTVTSTMIADGTIVNADINASAAIAGTKISPDFGSQTIATTGVFSHALGAAATPSVTFTGDLDTGVFSPGADQVAISTNAVERVEFGTGEVVFNDGGANYDFRIEGDTNANLFFVDASAEAVGIGTSSPGHQLDVVSAATSVAEFNGPANANIALNSDTVNLKLQCGGEAIFGSTTNHPTAFVTNNTERVRIDSSGRLLVGTSTARSTFYNTASAFIQLEGGATSGGESLALVRNVNDIFGGSLILAKTRGTGDTIVTSGDTIGNVTWQGNDGSKFVQAARIEAQVDGTPGADDMPGRLVFFTTADGQSTPTERMRIDAIGALKTSTNGTYKFPAGTTEITHNDATSSTQLIASSTSFTGDAVTISTYRNTVNDSYKFLSCIRQGFAVALEIRDDGDVYNVNGTYGSLSDAKLKENIIDAQSQWDDIRQLRVRNYNFKPETNNSTHKQIGVIAQEIEDVCPGLVNTVADRDAEGNELGTVTKSVNYSVLYMKAVKALQEAMERIEALEADVAQLKGA